MLFLLVQASGTTFKDALPPVSFSGAFPPYPIRWSTILEMPLFCSPKFLDAVFACSGIWNDV